MNPGHANDSQGFWSSERRFQLVSDALFSLLPRCATVEKSKLSELTQNAIAALAYATPAEPRRTAINKSTVKLLQDAKPMVRIAGIQTQIHIIHLCGHQWVMMFLAQLLPFISELQEDDDEGVGKETKSWIKLLEEMKGENIAVMLQ